MSEEIDFTGFNFVRAKKVPVSYFTDGEMIRFAAARNRVEIDDGRTATLIRWITPRRTSQVRLQFLNGSFVTLKKNRIVAVEIEPLNKGQHHEPTNT